MKESFSPPALEEDSLFYTEERKAEFSEMLVRIWGTTRPHNLDVSNFHTFHAKKKFTQLQVFRYVLGSWSVDPVA